MNTDDTDSAEEMDGRREKIIEILEWFHGHKQNYIDPVCPAEAEKFLYGFDVGCFACGVLVEWQAVAEQRGWKLGPRSPIAQMRATGLSEIAVIDELMSFRLDAKRRFDVNEASDP